MQRLHLRAQQDLGLGIIPQALDGYLVGAERGAVDEVELPRVFREEIRRVDSGVAAAGSCVDRQRVCVSGGGDGVGEPFRVARLGEITYLCFHFRCLAFLSLILDDAAAAEDSALFGRFISYDFIIFDKIDFAKYNFEKIIDEKILGF